MRNKLGLLLWIVFALIAVAATFYGLVILTDAVVKMAVAVIAAAAGIMTAILTHTLQQMREQDMERLRKKQENYALIIGKLGAYLRNPEENGDDFTSAHLLSWVVGSPEVVKLTLQFMGAKNVDTLNKLLMQMRSDLKMQIDSLVDTTTKDLFPELPPPKTPGALKQ